MVLFLGDIHGKFLDLISILERLSVSDCIIIQVGDFGLGFKPYNIDRNNMIQLNNFLHINNIELLAIRGNHDNPKFFDGSQDLSNIKLIPDYTVLNIEGQNFLFIGGAISIDRRDRQLENLMLTEKDRDFLSWYEGEEVIIKDVSQLRNIDVLVTHSTIQDAWPFNNINFGSSVDHYTKNDPSLKLELSAERQSLQRLYNELCKNNDIKYHYYGHYHNSYVIDDYKGCKQVLLNINELYEHKL